MNSKEWPGTTSIDMMNPECIKMLWELTMDISNRLSKLEKHVESYFVLSNMNNEHLCSIEDDRI